MPFLRIPPAIPVRSLAELFAIASAVAQEAMVHYTAIAARMRDAGQLTLVDIFDRLATAEASNCDRAVRWAEEADGHVSTLMELRWTRSDIFDDEGTGTCDPRLLTPYRALSMAVHNEERAFAFWSYVAAHADLPDIQRKAESIAREELEHVAILRRERRRAFHGERADQATKTIGAGAVVDLATLERHLADLLEVLAGRVEPERRDELMKMSNQARQHGQELASSTMMTLDALPTDRISDDPVALAEFLADRYLQAADILRDEEALSRTQALAGRAVSRLAWLKQIQFDHQGPEGGTL